MTILKRTTIIIVCITVLLSSLTITGKYVFVLQRKNVKNYAKYEF